MEEIIRFLQLRQVQKLSDEQKMIVGLSLFPDGKLSELATKLKNSGCDKVKYALEIKAYKDSKNDKDLISDLSQINPVILSFYKWLDFKSSPIKIRDFEDYVHTIKINEEFDVITEWTSYANSWILAICNKDINSDHCIDFQLLIRACHIFKLCIGMKDNKPVSIGSEKLINELFNLPIILPEGILISRCCERCSEKDKIELPDYEVIHNEDDGSSPDKAVKASSYTKIEPGIEEKLPCECKCDESCHAPSNYCMYLQTYISDLFIIKEELARYAEGDVADIENILAGEKKVRRQRNLIRTEDSKEQENETIASEERDHQVSEKFSLQEEVKNIIYSKVHLDAGVTATLKYGESVTLSSHANVTSDFSKSVSQKIARSYSKDITVRSASKIQEKVRKLQISKIINEFKDKNRQSTENTDSGADHRTGIYYWVNKVTHAQVFNYGKHMMFDVIVPEPASIFKKLYQLKINNNKKTYEPEKPVI